MNYFYGMIAIIESYQPINKTRVMEIFESNVPKYFDAREKEPFNDFLDNIKGEYFIIRKDDLIVGAGGFCEESKGEARICWLMIDRESHFTGMGTLLMKEFEQRIEKRIEFERITLKTTQHTDKFYEKLGYKTQYTKNDFWFPGLHLYFMEKPTK